MHTNVQFKVFTITFQTVARHGDRLACARLDSFPTLEEDTSEGLMKYVTHNLNCAYVYLEICATRLPGVVRQQLFKIVIIIGPSMVVS